MIELRSVLYILAFALFIHGLMGLTGPRTAVRVGLQTNGVRLDSRFLRLFGELGVRVGVGFSAGPGGDVGR